MEDEEKKVKKLAVDVSGYKADSSSDESVDGAASPLPKGKKQYSALQAQYEVKNKSDSSSDESVDGAAAILPKGKKQYSVTQIQIFASNNKVLSGSDESVDSDETIVHKDDMQHRLSQLKCGVLSDKSSNNSSADDMSNKLSSEERDVVGVLDSSAFASEDVKQDKGLPLVHNDNYKDHHKDIFDFQSSRPEDLVVDYRKNVRVSSGLVTQHESGYQDRYAKFVKSPGNRIFTGGKEKKRKPRSKTFAGNDEAGKSPLDNDDVFGVLLNPKVDGLHSAFGAKNKDGKKNDSEVFCNRSEFDLKAKSQSFPRRKTGVRHGQDSQKPLTNITVNEFALEKVKDSKSSLGCS